LNNHSAALAGIETPCSQMSSSLAVKNTPFRFWFELF